MTPDDAHRALLIYGPDVATLKGKMIRGAAAPRAPTFEAVLLPPLLRCITVTSPSASISFLSKALHSYTPISHVNPDIVTDIIRKIEERFDKMSVTRDVNTFSWE